jgi:hypothetical protein
VASKTTLQAKKSPATLPMGRPPVRWTLRPLYSQWGQLRNRHRQQRNRPLVVQRGGEPGGGGGKLPGGGGGSVFCGGGGGELYVRGLGPDIK